MRLFCKICNLFTTIAISQILSRKYEIKYEINFPFYDAGADYADSDSSKDSKESHGKGLLNNFVYYLRFQNKLNLTSVRRSRHKI